MTNLTDLGVRELRDGIRAGTFSAREVADSFIVAVSKAKQLNAFLTARWRIRSSSRSARRSSSTLS